MSKTILEMRNITKVFPGVKALDDVNFSVQQGEIHFVVGENGAGKSTLMKVLSGIYPTGDYDGEIIFNGEIVDFRKISDSEKAGLAIINQELALVPEMTVYENIYLAHEIKSNGIINWNQTIHKAAEQLDKVKLKVNPGLKVKDLNVGQQQLVEIAKALSKNVTLLILDEPTAALNETDSDNLLNLLVELKKQGVTSIMISHKLKEVTAIADSVTVLRDGKTISTISKSEINEDRIIKDMVGREINNIYPPREKYVDKEIILETKNINSYDFTRSKKVVKNAHIVLRKGEVVGLAGLMGSGRTELALTIFGNPKKYETSGDVYIHGEKVNFNHPKDAIKRGIIYVSEDRKHEGLILKQDVKQNISIINLYSLVKNGIIDKNKEIMVAEKYCKDINIKTPSIQQIVENLSGGNQQKVSISKGLFSNPEILILDEPTRGIDVGAKFEIYTLINELINEGMSIIMISSELPELLAMSDRLYVVAEGRITGELSKAEATQENVMRLATL
ncbi:MAG: sugar ABC transporter ATP-binding protein [Candidatus Izemoplasmatales bacterium]|nr:sugar ABC transporter ATP-binding protein [Candidatus Izemoplasmatales bacterium]